MLGRRWSSAVIVGLVAAGSVTAVPASTSADVAPPDRVVPLRQGYQETRNGVVEQLLGSFEAGDAFGRAVTFGDFDGNGFDDLAIGAPGEDFGADFDDSGAVNVVYGGPDGPRLDNDRYIDQSDFVGPPRPASPRCSPATARSPTPRASTTRRAA